MRVVLKYFRFNQLRGYDEAIMGFWAAIPILGKLRLPPQPPAEQALVGQVKIVATQPPLRYV